MTNLPASLDASKAMSDATYERMYRSLSSKSTALSNASQRRSKAAEAVFEISRYWPEQLRSQIQLGGTPNLTALWR